MSTPIAVRIPSPTTRGLAGQLFGCRRVLCTNASRPLPVARLTSHGWRWLLLLRLLFRPGIRVGPDRTKFCVEDALDSAANGNGFPQALLSDAGRLQGTAGSASRARAHRLCIHQWLLRPECYRNTCILLPCFYN